MGKEILRLIIRFAVRLAVAGVIFLAGVLLNGAVFNSNYGGGLPVIMLLFGPWRRYSSWSLRSD